MTSLPTYSSFLVRVWRRPTNESGDLASAETEWLIQVELIPSGRREYFGSLEGLIELLAGEVSGRRDGPGNL